MLKLYNAEDYNMNQHRLKKHVSLKKMLLKVSIVVSQANL